MKQVLMMDGEKERVNDTGTDDGQRRRGLMTQVLMMD